MDRAEEHAADGELTLEVEEEDPGDRPAFWQGGFTEAGSRGEGGGGGANCGAHWQSGATGGMFATADVAGSGLGGSGCGASSLPSGARMPDNERQSLQGLFFERCVREYRQGRITQAVALLKAGLGYKGFRAVLEWPVCFVHERLAFAKPSTTHGVQSAAEGEAVTASMTWGARVQNPHGSVVVYLGPAVQSLAAVFSRIGSVPGLNGWALPPGGSGGS
ncbi:hypothetical protein GPECTOR_49g467 [Gonium pectorale]|uniref:Uncharacterized protein n=1 Tax=Gonium pectorale TaxID=33097 RepID=A0A150G7Y1_GONPE|nr:hypothetical protein GPECTOR_49g467 [Gonium pectorale]|eukprot:KXZ45883.1 hypothetical protein GPECTOR_49g467 [Gonium pectorale]